MTRTELTSGVEKMFKSRGLSAKVVVLGRFVDIETTACHRAQINLLMCQAGFVGVHARDGMHIDGREYLHLAYKIAA